MAEIAEKNVSTEEASGEEEEAEEMSEPIDHAGNAKEAREVANKKDDFTSHMRAGRERKPTAKALQNQQEEMTRRAAARNCRAATPRRSSARRQTKRLAADTDGKEPVASEPWHQPPSKRRSPALGARSVYTPAAARAAMPLPPSLPPSAGAGPDADTVQIDEARTAMLVGALAEADALCADAYEREAAAQQRRPAAETMHAPSTAPFGTEAEASSAGVPIAGIHAGMAAVLGLPAGAAAATSAAAAVGRPARRRRSVDIAALPAVDMVIVPTAPPAMTPENDGPARAGTVTALTTAATPAKAKASNRGHKSRDAAKATCHKCAANLLCAVPLKPSAHCPLCGTHYHLHDCGRRFENLLQGAPVPAEVLEACPKCAGFCMCGGGDVACHAARARAKRERKRMAEERSALGLPPLSEAALEAEAHRRLKLHGAASVAKAKAQREAWFGDVLDEIETAQALLVLNAGGTGMVALAVAAEAIGEAVSNGAEAASAATLETAAESEGDETAGAGALTANGTAHEPAAAGIVTPAAVDRQQQQETAGAFVCAEPKATAVLAAIEEAATLTPAQAAELTSEWARVRAQIAAGRSAKEAAASLKLSMTCLKKICRAHGCTRWPARRIKACRQVRAHLQGVLQLVLAEGGSGGQTQAARRAAELRAQLAHVQAEEDAMVANPALAATRAESDLTRRLRQNVYRDDLRAQLATDAE